MVSDLPSNDADPFDALVDALVLTPAELAAARRAAAPVAAALRRAFRPTADEATRDDYLVAGSIGKRLAIRPTPPVDLLYLLPGDDPQAGLLARMHQALRAALPDCQVAVAEERLLVSSEGLVIAAVPALERQGAFAMLHRGDWVLTNPVAEMTALRLSDSLSGGRTTRLALLLKAWKEACQVTLPSFAIEVLVREFFGEVAPAGWPAALADFFAWARQRTPRQFDLPGRLDQLAIGDAWHPAAEAAYWRCVLAGRHAASGDVAAALAEWRILLGPRFGAG
jgi:hypothetical protein